MRIMMPDAVQSMISSFSPTTLRDATGPVLSVTFWSMTPLPPRPWALNSLSSVRLPKPCCVTTSTSFSGVMMSIDTSSSPSRKVIPLTPYAVRPTALTSFTENLMLMPSFVPKIISSFLSTSLTPINSSSSLKDMAIIPVFRLLSYSESSVFLTVPFFVTKIR